MFTIIGGGFAGLSAAYFLHRAGKEVTLLEWSRGLGGRSSTRNVGYRTMDCGAQRIDLSPLSTNQLETEARALLRAVAVERGVLQHTLPFPGPVFRFDGRSVSTAQQVDLPNWSYLEGGMTVLANSLVKDISVRTHTRISDIVFPDDKTRGVYQLRNQRGETTPSDGIVIALPAPYALAMLLPHAETNKKVKKIVDLFNDVNYEPMIGAMFGTTKIDFRETFTALFTDDVTAPIFWLSQEGLRRPLGIKKEEMAFVLQLGAEVSRDYVLKTDRETFIAIERVFEEVLDVALPDITYGEIQRWPAAFLSSSPFTVDTIKPGDFKTPLYLAGDYVAGQSSMASAFWSGKQIADRLTGEDTFKFIEEPVREQARLSEEEWHAVVPPEKKERKTQANTQRRNPKKKFDEKKGKRVSVPGGLKKEKKRFPAKGRGVVPQGRRQQGPPQGGGRGRSQAGGPPRQGGWQQRAPGGAGGRPRQGGQQRGPGQGYGGQQRGPSQGYGGGGQRQGQGYGGQRGPSQGYGGGGQRGPGQGYGGGQQRGPGQGYGGQRGPGQGYAPREQGQGYAPREQGQGYAPREQGQGYAPREQRQDYGAPRPQRPPGQGRKWGEPTYNQGQGRPQRPQQGGGQGGGGYRQPRDYQPRDNQPRDNQPRRYDSQAPNRGERKPVRGQVVYSTNVRRDDRYGNNDRGPRDQNTGNRAPSNYDNRPRRPQRPPEDDNIGNR